MADSRQLVASMVVSLEHIPMNQRTGLLRTGTPAGGGEGGGGSCGGPGEPGSESCIGESGNGTEVLHEVVSMVAMHVLLWLVWRVQVIIVNLDRLLSWIWRRSYWRKDFFRNRSDYSSCRGTLRGGAGGWSPSPVWLESRIILIATLCHVMKSFMTRK